MPQVDLPVAEGTNLLAPNDDHADDHAVAEHRHACHRAIAAETLRLGLAVVGVGQRVEDLHRPLFCHHPTDEEAALWPHRNAGDVRFERR